MEPLGCIYLITCIETNGKYVGQSQFSNPINRYKQHWQESKRDRYNYKLYNAMRKYGYEKFKVETLCIVPHKSLNNMEEYWAEQLETYCWDSDLGYNMVWCGQSFRLGIPINEEVRERISKTCKEYWTSEIREQKSIQMKNNITEEDRIRSSQASINFWNNEENYKKMVEMRLGKPQNPRNEQAKQNMSNASKGKPKSNKFKQSLKISASKKFDDIFNKRLEEWIYEFNKKGSHLSNSKNVSKEEQHAGQWRYDMTRKKKEGNLSQKYINILENTPGWEWS